MIFFEKKETELVARPAVKQNKPKTLVPMTPKKTTSIRRRVWNRKREELQAPDHPQDLSVRDGRPWLGPGTITIAQQKVLFLPLMARSSSGSGSGGSGPGGWGTISLFQNSNHPHHTTCHATN